MVGMHVGEEHGADIGGIDACGLDIGEQLAGRGQQVVAGARLHQGQPPGRVDQEGIDLRAPCGAEVIRQDLARLVLRDIAQHLERAVEKAVADRGDDNVADAAVVDPGDLLLRNLDHALMSSLQ